MICKPCRTMGKNLKRIALLLFCMYVIAVILLCVIQTDNIPELPKRFLGIPMDKVAHFIMFCPFVILGYSAFYPTRQELWRRFAVLCILTVLGCVFAFSTERLQAMTSYRSCEIKDMVADVTGIMTGAIAAFINLLIRHK